MLDTIAGGSYGECPYVEIVKKLEKISRNNKAWRTRKSDTGKNTFVMQPAHNPATSELRDEMDQIRTKLGLVLKHVNRGEEKVNAVNYLSKPPSPNHECYYPEDTYAVNEHMGGFRPSAQGPNKDNWRHGQGNQGWKYGNYNREGHYVRDGNYNRDSNFYRGNYGKMMRMFDASDEHNKELRNDLAGIGQKVDTHEISIEQLQLQLA